MSETTKKILFVEDEPVAQTVYRNRLQREGFETLFAENGEVALTTLSRGRPDLIVLDLMMPKVNGTEMLRHIRSEQGLKGTPVLVLSNAYVNGLSQKAMESGATRGLLKTECTPARLVAAVRDMLGYSPPFGLSNKPANDESQAQAFIAAAKEAHADEMSLKQTREEFVKKAPAEIAKMREYSLAYIKTGGTPEAAEYLGNLYQQVRFLATRAGMSGCPRIALVASAFEALLFEVVSKPEKANASVSQTFAQAVDCLERLCQRADAGSGEPYLKAKVLVIDDDTVCNFAMVSALQRAHFEPESSEDSAKALQMAQTVHYDIILLDINMPGMNGFEVCRKLRSMTEYRETPVIFITAHGDFQNRAQSILSGGNDLIPKPVSPVELVLKTTMRLLQPQALWSEESAAAAAQKLVAQNAAQNGAPAGAPPENADPQAPKPTHKPPHSEAPAAKSEPPLPKLKLAETPAAPAAVNGAVADPQDTTFLAWPKSSGEAPKPVEPLKMAGQTTVPARADQEAARPAPPEIKEPLPKMEAPQATEAPAPSQPISPTKAPAERKETPASAAKQTVKPGPEPSKSQNMETKTKPTVDEAARGVARIIFGDENATDMNVRLTRIALERYNVPGTQNLDEVARGVVQIIFGDDKVNDMNVRLTRIALERYNVTEVLGLHNGSK